MSVPASPARAPQLARLALAATALAALVACSTAPVAPTAPIAPLVDAVSGSTRVAAKAPPRLIVFFVVDGLPIRQVLGYRDQLQPDGFRRFLDRGTWFANAYYAHGYTVTAAGHSVMLTGAYPQRTGIIANEWRDPKTSAPVYNTGDTAYSYLDNKTEPLAGTSPRMLLAETVGDVLRGQDPASKVIGVSGKDRGAILPAGHKGTAYMYMRDSGRFASSSYYMQQHPQWVSAFNAAKPADAFFGKTWTPLLPGYDCPYDPSPAAACAYARSAPDGQAWQSNTGNGNRLPVTLGAKMDGPGPRFYENILPSPFGDELTLAFARAAVEGEQLGQDDHTDILTVSLSSHDYINHAFGPESRLSQDHFLHLDRYLQGFFQYLDAKVGAGQYMAMLTADHGFVDTPEWGKQVGRDAQRVNPAQTLAWVNTGLSKTFGEGRYATFFSGSGLLFDEKLIAERGLQPDAIYAEAKALLLQVPGIGDAFTRAQLQGTEPVEPHLTAMRKSWHPERAAPLQIIVKPNWLFSSRTAGSSHGTPYEYDQHVPILAWGERWVGRGEVTQRVEVADIAPTLAGILQVRVPAQAQGKPLPLPLSAPTASRP